MNKTMEDFIQIKENKEVKKIGIKNSKGEDTGEYLEFDMADIELPLKLSECENKHKKNYQYVKNQFVIIDKKQDKKGKKLLSANEEEKMKVLSDFYKKEAEALDLFLGKNGTSKILKAMGRKPYWDMYEDINELLKPLLPLFEKSVNSITSRVKEKYQIEESDVLK